MNSTSSTPSMVRCDHYIHEGWSKEPKFTFLRIRDEVTALRVPMPKILDVGCATGELVSFLASEIAGGTFTGIDISPKSIKRAQELLPHHQFSESNILDLPDSWNESFDIITAVGVLTFFAGEDLEKFWNKALKLLKPKGSVVVLGPLNEFGIDMDLKHRKWVAGSRLDWETGWSIPSIQTIEKILLEKFFNFKILPFAPMLDLNQKEDPIRTWTVPYGENSRQLTNGLKLLVDNYTVRATKH